MTEIFDNWRKRLAGETVPTHDGDPQPGFYRSRKKEASTNEVWWTPVAYFMSDPTSADGEEIVGVIGDRNMTDREVSDMWTYVCGYPIPEEVYFTFDGQVEVPNDQWPKGLLGEPKRPPFANAGNGAAPAREAVMGDNNPPEEEKLPPQDVYREKMTAAIGAAPKAVPKNSDELALLEGSKNRIAELRLAADKERKAAVEPHLREQQRINNIYGPLVAMCETAESALKTLSLTYQENERKRIAKEKAEAEAKAAKELAEKAEAQRLADEAAARAADRAIARGEPEPEPELTEEAIIPVPDPAPVVTAPVKVAPTYGRRTTKAEVKKFAVINDPLAVAKFFIANEEMVALIDKLATTAIRAGVEVPGATHREGLI